MTPTNLLIGQNLVALTVNCQAGAADRAYPRRA